MALYEVYHFSNDCHPDDIKHLFYDKIISLHLILFDHDVYDDDGGYYEIELAHPYHILF